MQVQRLSVLFKKMGRVQTYEKAEVVLSTDRPHGIYLVEEGYIKRYMIKNDGALMVQSIYGPGDIFPLTAVYRTAFNQDIYTGPEVYYYEAMCVSRVRGLETDLLCKAVDNDPMVYKDLLSVAGERFFTNIQQLENIGLSVFYNRVAHQLCFFARKFGKQVKTGIQIQVPLTQQDIADTLGATRETISLSIAQLRKKGLIKTKRHIIIPDLDALQKEAFE